MHRKEKEIKDRNVIDEIIRKSNVCRIAFSDNNQPYILPMSFGYDGEKLFFHCAKVGRKLDILAKNNKVCVEFEIGFSVVAHEEVACKWSCSFQSVIAFGTATEVIDPDRKAEGLGYIMKQYSDKDWDFEPKSLKGLKVFEITIDSITGKQSMDHATSH